MDGGIGLPRRESVNSVPGLHERAVIWRNPACCGSDSPVPPTLRACRACTRRDHAWGASNNRGAARTGRPCSNVSNARGAVFNAVDGRM